MTEILKNYQQCLTNPNGKIDFENDNLKTYLFLQRPLEHTPISTSLLKDSFSREIIITIMNIYLSHLEKKENEKFQALKDDAGEFDTDKILESICKDLNEDFENYSFIFHFIEFKIKNYYEEKYPNGKIKNPLDEVLDSPFVKNFFDGLDLDYHFQNQFYRLGLLNIVDNFS